jgi:uncharacterized protein (DUF58 family)
MSTTVNLSDDFSRQLPLELLATQIVEGYITGMHKSPFHGFSVEFAEHRLYNTGENTRHIDWKLFGRTDKLFIKRFEEETNLRCQMVIDSSASMYYPQNNLSKIKFATYATAALTYLLKKQRDASGLSIIGNDIEFHTPAKLQQSHHNMLMNKLETLLNSKQQANSSNIVSSLHKIAELVHKRSLVVIFSDMFDSKANNTELLDALQHLRYNKHEVILFHVVDKQTELEFDFDNRPYKFIDSETGEQLKLVPSQIKQQYLSSIEAFTKDLKIKCAQYKIDFHEAHVGNDFHQILTQFLIKRSKLY